MDTIKENRLNFIGGSDVPILLNISKFKTREEHLLSYIKKELLNIDTPYTLYGNFMEEKIRKYINNLLNTKYIPQYKIFEDLRIRCNTDGYDYYSNSILEIKTNNGKHTNNFDYELQMQLYMWAFNCDYGYLVEYIRPKDFYTGIIYEDMYDEKNYNLEFNELSISITKIKRNNQMIAHILKEIKKFWLEVKKVCLKKKHT